MPVPPPVTIATLPVQIHRSLHNIVLTHRTVAARRATVKGTAPEIAGPAWGSRSPLRNRLRPERLDVLRSADRRRELYWRRSSALVKGSSETPAVLAGARRAVGGALHGLCAEEKRSRTLRPSKRSWKRAATPTSKPIWLQHQERSAVADPVGRGRSTEGTTSDDQAAAKVASIVFDALPKLENDDNLDVVLKGGTSDRKYDRPKKAWADIIAQVNQPHGIANAVTAKDARPETFEPIDPTSDFPADQAIFHAIVSVRNLPPNSSVRKRPGSPSTPNRAAPANTVMDTVETKVDGTRNLHLTLKRSAGNCRKARIKSISSSPTRWNGRCRSPWPGLTGHLDAARWAGIPASSQTRP